MTERYSHLPPSHMHEAVKKFTLGFTEESYGHVLGTDALNAKSQLLGCDRK